MNVKIAKIKTAKEILGTQSNVTMFAEVLEGRHYTFNEAMNAWGVTKIICVFVPMERSSRPRFDYYGTLAGDNVYNFRGEWLEEMFDHELDDNDPRAVALARAMRGDLMGPEDFFRKMLGMGEE